MKVSVLGAGAIGSMFGGLLQQQARDLEVLLVTRGEHGKTLSQRGVIELVGPWGKQSVPIKNTQDVAAIAGSDYVLMTVKSQGTEDAIRAAEPYLGNATVVSIQNGINDHLLLKYVAPDHLVMGMTATNVALLTPGEVSLQLDGFTIFGPAAGCSMGQHVTQATNLLKRIRVVGLKFLAHPNALGMRYNKLTINALGYASCLSASNFITECLCHTTWRRVVGRPIVEECLRVYEAAQIELEPVPGRSDLARLQRLMRTLERPVMRGVISFWARQIYKRRPIVFSLYQDLLHGKTTEVEHINAEIVRLSRTAGTAAPINQEIVRMVHELESRSNNTFFDRQEVIDRLQAEQRVV
jgi:2-dehydropantoate 2-reductase